MKGIKMAFKYLVLIVIRVIYYILDLIIPKDKTLMLGASKNGAESLNIKYLQEYINNQNSNLKMYALNKEVRSEYELNPYSLKAFIISLKCRYVFLTHGPGDLIYAKFSFRKKRIYLGHGTPYKTFLFTNKSLNFWERFFLYFEQKYYDLYLASSEQEKKKLVDCFRVRKERIVVTGLPRNQWLLENKKSDISQSVQETASIKRGLYAPTFRDEQRDAFIFDNQEEVEGFNSYLKSKNLKIDVKLHPNSKISKKINLNYLSHFSYFQGQGDITKYLPTYDFLITDYSSIFIDYLVLCRPIILMQYDCKLYEKYRGLLYKKDELAIPIQYSKSELINTIESALSEHDQKRNLENLKKMKMFFHQYDRDICERIINLSLSLK